MQLTLMRKGLLRYSHSHSFSELYRLLRAHTAYTHMPRNTQTRQRVAPFKLNKKKKILNTNCNLFICLLCFEERRNGEQNLWYVPGKRCYANCKKKARKTKSKAPLGAYAYACSICCYILHNN